MLKKASFLFVTKSRKRRERQGESEWEELWEERAMSRSLRSSQLRAPKLWEGRQKWRRVGLPCSLIAKGPSSFNTLEVCKRLGFLHRNEVTVNYVSRLIPVYAAVIMDGLLRSPKKGPLQNSILPRPSKCAPVTFLCLFAPPSHHQCDDSALESPPSLYSCLSGII